MLTLFLPGEIRLCKIDFMRSRFTSTFNLPIFISKTSVLQKISYHSKVLSPGNYNVDFLLSVDNGINYTSLLNISLPSGTGERVITPSLILPEKALLRVIYLKDDSIPQDIQLDLEIKELCAI